MSNFRKTLLPDASVSRQPAVDYYHAYMEIMPLLNHSFPSMRSEASSHSHDQPSIRNMCMRHAPSRIIVIISTLLFAVAAPNYTAIEHIRTADVLVMQAATCPVILQWLCDFF